jgi:hypothetical protein
MMDILTRKGSGDHQEEEARGTGRRRVPQHQHCPPGRKSYQSFFHIESNGINQQQRRIKGRKRSLRPRSREAGNGSRTTFLQEQVGNPWQTRESISRREIAW